LQVTAMLTLRLPIAKFYLLLINCIGTNAHGSFAGKLRTFNVRRCCRRRCCRRRRRLLPTLLQIRH
jgi:hypothetical protein